MKTKRFLAVAVMLVVACSMAMAQSIYGTWGTDNLDNEPIKCTFTFTEDNVFKIDGCSTNTSAFDEEHDVIEKIYIKVEFRCEIADSTIHLVETVGTPECNIDVDFTNFTEEEKVARLQEMREEYDAQEAQIISQLKQMPELYKEELLPYTVEGNTLTFPDKDGTYTFTRIGEAPVVKSQINNNLTQ